MKISNRLKRACEYTRDFDFLADIGCDHGLLAIYAVKNNFVKKALCCDINEGPLLQAKKNIELYDLVNIIETKRCDGLIGTINIDCYTICGMGGILIKDIIHHSIEIAKNAKRFILEPNSEWKVLREFLITNGFEIFEEDFIFEKKYYPIIVCKYTGINQDYNQEEIEFGRILLKNKNENLKQFLLKNILLLEKTNSDKILGKINYLKKVINEYYEN